MWMTCLTWKPPCAASSALIHRPCSFRRSAQNGRFASRPVVKQFAIESYAGAPIFLPDGRLFGALCALDSQAMLFDDPNLPETLSLLPD